MLVGGNSFFSQYDMSDEYETTSFWDWHPDNGIKSIEPASLTPIATYLDKDGAWYIELDKETI